MSVDSYPDLLVSGVTSGYRILRVIGVALVYKLIEGLSRYTLAQEEDIFRGFRTLSIYGATQVIPLDEAFINFRDLGPMIAGLCWETLTYLEVL